jgi:hypothetical protein
MPLKARMDGRLLISVALPPGTQWEDVREAARAGRVVMACCGVSAIPKQLSSGTRFFAHKPGAADCFWEHETPEHLRLKAAACEAAAVAGAIADVEVQGPDWIADTLAVFEGQRRAIEIQLSPQTAAETRYRTARYRASGVEVLWLFRKQPEGLPLSSELPTAVLSEDIEIAEEEVAELAAAFAIGCLVWRNHDRQAPVTLVGYDVQCANCGEIFHQAPYAIVRASESDGNQHAWIADATRVVFRGRQPWASWLRPGQNLEPDALGRKLGSGPNSCPVCRAEAIRLPLSTPEALAWPHSQVDGIAAWSERAGWYHQPSEPVAYQPICDAARWTEILLTRNLLLDRDAAAARAPDLRKPYEEKVQRAEQAERERRRRLEEEYHAAAMRVASLSEEIIGETDDRSRVNAEVENAGFGTVAAVRLRFPYDEQARDTLRSLRAKWDPDAKTWTVAIGYGEEYRLRQIRDLVLTLRSRHDRRRNLR